MSKILTFETCLVQYKDFFVNNSSEETTEGSVFIYENPSIDKGLLRVGDGIV